VEKTRMKTWGAKRPEAIRPVRSCEWTYHGQARQPQDPKCHTFTGAADGRDALALEIQALVSHRMLSAVQ